MTNTATLLLLTAACLSLAVAGPAASKAACGSQQFTCQLQNLMVINCSSEAAALDAAGADASPRFVQRYPNFEPSLVSLILPARGGASNSFTVANLDGLVTCFQLTNAVTLRLVAGTAEFKLTPRSLAAFRGMRRITLWLRFQNDSIPSGLFSAGLAASLENLQLETPGVREVAPGAFQQLRRLTRLAISNLRVPSLTGDTLRGLGQLRVLELRDNELLRLDAASFSASPSLQSVDLRTRSTGGVPRLAPDTFCGLGDLRQLQAPASWGLNCSHFASAKIHLVMLSRGAGVDTLSCVRLLGQKKCGTTAVREGTSTPTVALKTAVTTKTTTITTSSSTTTITTTITTTAKTTAIPKSTLTTKQATTASTKPTSTSTAATSAPKTSSTHSRGTTTTSSLPVTSTTTTSSTSSSSSSSSRPGRRSPDRQARSSSAGPAVAVVLVAVALILAGAAVAAFVAARGRRFGGLRRAASRQPIFSAAGGSMIDMRSIDGQDMQLWNPAYQQLSSPAADEVAVEGADRVESR